MYLKWLAVAAAVPAIIIVALSVWLIRKKSFGTPRTDGIVGYVQKNLKTFQKRQGRSILVKHSIASVTSLKR